MAYVRPYEQIRVCYLETDSRMQHSLGKRELYLSLTSFSSYNFYKDHDDDASECLDSSPDSSSGLLE
jgi:hypothetical protein